MDGCRSTFPQNWYFVSSRIYSLYVCVLDSKIIIGSSKEVGCMSGLHPLRVRACQIPVRCCSSDDFFVDRFF